MMKTIGLESGWVLNFFLDPDLQLKTGRSRIRNKSFRIHNTDLKINAAKVVLGSF